MGRQWTFGQRLGVGFAVMVLLAVAIGGVSVFALQNVVAAKDDVITGDAPRQVETERMRTFSESVAADARGFFLTKDDRFLVELEESRTSFDSTLRRLQQRPENEDIRLGLEAIARADAELRKRIDAATALRRTDATADAVVKMFDEQVVPKRTALDTAINDLASRQQAHLDAASAAASATASRATTIVIAMALGVVLLGVVIAFALARGLSRQIGAAVGQVQSSSAELQAAATQQATGAKEQATAMNEITTTINELLATSRQIAESAQRVAQVAGQTATSARSGDGTVEKAQEAIAAIRRQVDLVVHHMLELGKKSQQIGAVLDIVTELAEQTNILAINATIEAAGAGDAGKRFAIVADEIRKLADRVSGSTKEIRGLIDDVRGAVNTTVMATETGSKAVETGARQFGDVATAFKQIGGLVGTTTEAAREIELSTKQQSTAVEQVNVAIANVAQATKETEASSGQTLTTASQLAGLSKDLLRLVEPQAIDSRMS